MKKKSLIVLFACLIPVAANCATPIVGDWDGDGYANVGLFSGNKFLLDFDNDGVADKVIAFGRSTDLPVCGDWDGDGRDDIGVFRSADRKFFLDYNQDGVTDETVTIGRSSDLPVVGDWDSDGADDIGVFRPSGRRYYMDFNEDGIHDRAVTIGKLGDYSLVGDWDSDGADSIGIFRPDNKRFYLDDDDDGVHDHAQNFGSTNDVPIVGDWDGDGITDIGAYRPSNNMFYLDEDFDGIAEWSIPGTVEDENDDIDVTGTWMFLDDYYIDGISLTLTAILVQSDNSLSGTFDVSADISGTNYNFSFPLTGIVDNSNVCSFQTTMDFTSEYILTLEFTDLVVSGDGSTFDGEGAVFFNGYYEGTETCSFERQ
ncbi:MAG: hypothetical protein HY885_12685 [Deltaproteobacteria bacterium]|nr:hypothetical protein [Deltaproteobacteria bacterium]